MKYCTVTLLFLGIFISNAQVVLTVEEIPGFSYTEDKFKYKNPSISPDGNTLIMIMTEGDHKTTKFVQYTKSDGKWVGPEPLILLNSVQGSLSKQTSAAFDPAGNRIYFHARFKDSYGKNDLYYSEKINGSWQLPVNLGEAINSGQGERFPWISPSGDRLYFESYLGDQEDGMRRVFFCVKQTDGSWGEPQVWFENLDFQEIGQPVVFRDNAILLTGMTKPKGFNFNFLSVADGPGSWSVPLKIIFDEESLAQFGDSDEQPDVITTTEGFEYIYLTHRGNIYQSKVPQALQTLVDNAFMDVNMSGRPVAQSRSLTGGNSTQVQQLISKPKEESERNRTALVIGNGSYNESPLKNPVNDANLISAELQTAGFNVISVTDSDLKGMRNAVRQFGDALRNNPGVGLFYYAGHGLQKDGVNYLVPVTADIQREYDIEDECMRADRVLRMMEMYDNPLNIIILDACRNNPYASSTRSMDKGLAQPQIAPTGSIIAFATAPGNVASDGDGSNGLYTQEFVKAMQKPGLKIEELFKTVRINVMQLSGEQQNPWENSSLTGDFYFYKP